jgi:hypothetical protein
MNIGNAIIYLIGAIVALGWIAERFEKPAHRPTRTEKPKARRANYYRTQREVIVKQESLW